MMKQVTTDVIIVGGGLAGMSLALQLYNRNPNLRIVIIEKNTFPVPDTTAKVGESTVEIGAHYFTDVLGLSEHFQHKHLHKHGLRLFFGSGAKDSSDYDELGVSELFGVPAYQIERGTLENYLYQLLTSKGMVFLDGAVPDKIELDDKNHQVTCIKHGEHYCLAGRWVIDAAGRQALLRNQLQLKKETGHKGNAVFFRVNRRVTIDEWSDNKSWHDRVCAPGKRWLSTNHLMGAGYWIWIIPLASGATSFGIVMDDQALADSQISTFEDTLAWLSKEHPLCSEAIAGAELLDFKILQDYSYGARQLFSDTGWAMTGEAGAFSDPFYSPGSDFIALNNSFIARLIENDMAGKDIRFDCALFNKFNDSFFENTLSLYKQQYGGFGDRQMMSVKLVWDYSYYWGVFALLFFRNVVTELDQMRDIAPALLQAQKLNQQMQSLFVKRAEKRLILPAKGTFMDQYRIPCLRQFNQALNAYETDAKKTLEANISIMQKLLPYFEDILSDNPSMTIDDAERELLGDYRLSVLA